jgi:protein involved in polysaccharide export with SLBB domain
MTKHIENEALVIEPALAWLFFALNFHLGAYNIGEQGVSALVNILQQLTVLCKRLQSSLVLRSPNVRLLIKYHLSRRTVCAIAAAIIFAAFSETSYGVNFSETSYGVNKRDFQDSKPRQDPESALEPPAPAPSPESYHLDSGDILRVRFYDRYDRDDLNGDQVIGESGQLRLPRIGAFNARNKTIEELERDIRAVVVGKGEKLGYFSLEVIRCRPFYIVGLINRPGRYAYVPGLTVVQAVALAGGLYRSPVTPGEMIHEKTALTDTTSRLAEAIARRARLEAETKDAQMISMPKELMRLEPLKALEMLAVETAQLDRSRQSLNQQQSGLEKLIALKQSEADRAKLEETRLAQRINEQTRIFQDLQKLHAERVVNLQRFLEAVIALDSLQRDKQSNSAALSVAKTDLEKAQRDLALVTLGDKARIAKEIADAEFEITRLKRVAAQIADYEAVGGQSDYERVAIFKIIRGNSNAPGDFIQANEATVVMPGDVIKVDVQRESRLSSN